MAHFYGSMTGARGETTRTGTKSSGIVAHVRGWDRGIEVSIGHNETDGTDSIDISITQGSNGGQQPAGLIISAGDLTDILEGRAVLDVVPIVPAKGALHIFGDG